MSELIISSQGQMLARVELDTQISTAKAYPRQSVEKFLAEATLMATLDEETAESCIYSLSRNSTDRNSGKETQTFIKGESVRLAEIVANAWGNLHCGSRIIENDGKTITAEAVAWDLEKNVKVSKQVKRSITYRNGGTYSQDMQVVTGNAAASVALRNAILSVIPKSLVKKVYSSAVNFAIGDQKKIPTKADALIARFAKMGIHKDKIFAYFNVKSVGEFSADDIEEMLGIGTAIKDGNLPIDDAFIIKTDASSAATSVELDKKLERKTAQTVKPDMSQHAAFINDMDKK